MSLAVSAIKKRQVQGIFIATFQVTPSGTYPTNGEALGTTPESMHPLGKSPDILLVYGKAGFVFQYDHVNKKLLTYCNTAGGANGALGEHTNATYVANIVSVAHNGIAIWLT